MEYNNNTIRPIRGGFKYISNGNAGEEGLEYIHERRKQWRKRGKREKKRLMVCIYACAPSLNVPLEPCLLKWFFMLVGI